MGKEEGGERWEMVGSILQILPWYRPRRCISESWYYAIVLANIVAKGLR